MHSPTFSGVRPPATKRGAPPGEHADRSPVECLRGPARFAGHECVEKEGGGVPPEGLSLTPTETRANPEGLDHRYGHRVAVLRALVAAELHGGQTAAHRLPLRRTRAARRRTRRCAPPEAARRRARRPPASTLTCRGDGAKTTPIASAPAATATAASSARVSPQILTRVRLMRSHLPGGRAGRRNRGTEANTAQRREGAKRRGPHASTVRGVCPGSVRIDGSLQVVAAERRARGEVEVLQLARRCTRRRRPGRSDRGRRG